jgi:prophage regulatory protein
VETPTPARMLRRREVEQMIGLKRTAIYEMMTQGTFPRPVRIGARAIAWKLADIEAWIASREAA